MNRARRFVMRIEVVATWRAGHFAASPPCLRRWAGRSVTPPESPLYPSDWVLSTRQERKAAQRYAVHANKAGDGRPSSLVSSLVPKHPDCAHHSSLRRLPQAGHLLPARMGTRSHAPVGHAATHTRIGRVVFGSDSGRSGVLGGVVSGHVGCSGEGGSEGHPCATLCP